MTTTSAKAFLVLDANGIDHSLPRQSVNDQVAVREFLHRLVGTVTNNMNLQDDSMYMAGKTVMKVCRGGMREVVVTATSVDEKGERRMCSIFSQASIFITIRMRVTPPDYQVKWCLTYHHTPNVENAILCGDLDQFGKDFALLRLTENTLMYDVAMVEPENL